MSYRVPAGVCEQEYVVKKSRFIARVVPVTDREAVNCAVAAAKRDYPDARHHCWAYLLGSPRDARNAGMSDDGEPAGTAGKPILNVLQHGEVGDVLVVVIRYFGGIKLGAGGLVRAYGSATQQALDAAPTRALQTLREFTLEGDFSVEQPLRHFLLGVGGELLSVDYAERVSFRIGLDQRAESAFRDWCAAQGVRIL